MEREKTGAPTRIRKSLTALKGTDERKGYFYCLKLLGVLPPPPDSGFQKWVYYSRPDLYSPITNPRRLYVPKCLHDVLIASHSTSCEHNSFYFSYYHRNYTVLTEIFLNFAHQVLRGRQKKLKQVYPDPQFAFLYNKQNEALWNNVFTVYNNLKDIPDQIANHYWNPTNYGNDQDLKVLDELAPKKSTNDPIDLLFFNINNSYPWEINVPRRMYNQPNQYNVKDLGTGQGNDTNFFYKADVTYTTDQKNFVNGKLDPRQKSSVKVYGQDMHFLIKQVSGNNYTGWLIDNGNKVLHRNYTNYDDSEGRRNYAVNSIPADEILSNYGAKSKNLQYITKQEGKTNGLSNTYVEGYNNMVPHYQYAEALFNQNVTQFFYRFGIQASHNTMHNNCQTILSDSIFSVTSLLFFPYHSWIDCGIQLQIRRANDPANKFKRSYETIKSILTVNELPLPYLLQTIFKKAEVFSQTQLDWNISGSPLKPNAVGRYPICQYLSPQVIKKLVDQSSPSNDDLRVLEAAFGGRDYVITQQETIRDSVHLNDIYQNYYIDKLHPTRFYFLNNVKQYQFDYNYQIGQDLSNILDPYATNLPQYLKDMQDIWKPAKTVRRNAVKFAAQVSAKSKDIKIQISKRQTGNSLQAKQQGAPKLLGLGSPQIQENVGQPETEAPDEETQKVRKLFESGLHLFASYAPDTKNGPNLIFLRYKNVISKLHKQLSQKELDLLEEYACQGHLVGNIIIFGKEGGAKACQKCQKYKARFLDLDQNLRVRLPRIWQFLHLEALNEVLYDSKNKDIKIRCVSENVFLVPNDTFKDYRLIYGAEEIEVQLIDKTTSNESQYIRLDTESYSVSKNVINSVLSKKFYTFKSRFDFYKIFDVFNKNENDYFDSYVYKQLKGVVFVGSKKIEFNIHLPCYQRLLRLKLYIIGDSKDLQVVVEDADYEAKKAFYKNAV